LATSCPPRCRSINARSSSSSGADLILLVLDRSAPLDDEDRALIDRHRGGLLVANKSDLPAAWDASERGCLAISARNGAGLDALAVALVRALIPEPPPALGAIPFRPEHGKALGEARDLLARGRPEEAVRRLASLLEG
jgi:tRNA U34 5-carboxymethylaminomethyl modifying GTPase MnmE/TrmE